MKYLKNFAGHSLYFCREAFFKTATALALSLFLSLAVPAYAVSPTQSPVLLTDFLHCATGLESGNDVTESMTGGAQCAAEVALDKAMILGVSHLNAYGTKMFGRGFSLATTMRYSPFYDRRIQGDLDMVVPLRFALRSNDGDATSRAFFLQNGLTRWTDAHGFHRNDARFGFAYRTTTGLDSHGAPNQLGFYTLAQQNRERGHERWVHGIDYRGRWGKGFVNHYAVQSSWVDGRAGHQERAVGGSEIGVNLTPTTALDLNLAAGEWDTAHGRRLSGRVGLAWQPHTYLRLSSDLSGIGSDDPQATHRITFTMPLGRTQQSPQWHGLGLAADSPAQADDLWQRVVVVNRIEVIERERPIADLVGAAAVRFLQASAPTGNAIRVEITLPAAAAQAARVEVRLKPGTGDNPAVAGVDFVDAPVIVTIPEGDTSSIATLQLLRNPDLNANRALSVAVRYIEG